MIMITIIEDYNDNDVMINALHEDIDYLWQVITMFQDGILLTQ